LSTVLQILLFLPLTLSTLSTNAFLLLSLLFFIHSLVHGTLQLLWNTPFLPFMEVLIHPFLFLVSFNIFTQEVHPLLTFVATSWGKILNFWSVGFIILESFSSLIVAEKLGRAGRELAAERGGYQFGFLIASATTYFVCAWWFTLVSVVCLYTYFVILFVGASHMCLLLRVL
jgi:hypothetical protein